MLIKILIADDRKSMRAGLRSLLEKYDELEGTNESASSETRVDLAGEDKPGVVVMDITIPGHSGSEATQRNSGEIPVTKVIALSMALENHSVAEMQKVGTCGYLPKDRANKELIDAIREIVAGNIYKRPPAVELVLGECIRKYLSEETSIFPVLTPRELEVLKLVADGRSTIQIAEDIDISTKTVDTHRQHIMDKLNIRGIADLTRYAIRERITDL